MTPRAPRRRAMVVRGPFMPSGMVARGRIEDECLRPGSHGGMVGAVRMWRQSVGSVVVTTLVLMPSLATTCAASCLRPTAGLASSGSGAARGYHGSTTHAHHGSTASAGHGSTGSHGSHRVPGVTQREAGARAQLGAPAHDCQDHAGAVNRAGTVSSSARADGPVVSPFGGPRQVSLAIGASIAYHIRSTHPPPADRRHRADQIVAQT